MAANSSSIVGIKIWALRVVGVSHYGSSQLQKEVAYQLIREPSNAYDPLAIAVLDGNATKAHLKKEDARRLARVMDSNLPEGKFFIKFHHDAAVKSPKIGPEQMGNVGFRCNKEDLDAVSQLLAEVCLDFEVIPLKKQ